MPTWRTLGLCGVMMKMKSDDASSKSYGESDDGCEVVG